MGFEIHESIHGAPTHVSLLTNPANIQPHRSKTHRNRGTDLLSKIHGLHRWLLAHRLATFLTDFL